MAAVVICSALVHNARSSACGACGMWEDSWSHIIDGNNEESG